MSNDFNFKFDDEQDLFFPSTTHNETFSLEVHSGNTGTLCSFVFSNKLWIGGILILVVVLLLIGSKVIGSSAFQRDITITLRGSDASYVTMETPILLNRNIVGEVVAVDSDRVDIKILGNYAKNLRTDSRFNVQSSDNWFPGQAVICITSGNDNHPQLQNGAVVQFSKSVLPATIPWRFILLCIVAFSAVTLAVSYWLKLFVKAIFALAILGITIAVICFLNPGGISTMIIEQLTKWLPSL
jgi:hypothetical protein